MNKESLVEDGVIILLWGKRKPLFHVGEKGV
jgi:hypothetical protein